MTGVDFNRTQNGKDHYTSEYEVPDLVVRRGQPFTLTIKTDRVADAKWDVVVVQFAYGEDRSSFFDVTSLQNYPVIMSYRIKKGIRYK